MAGEVKPIRTKRDYEAALKEVERLWSAKAGTRDGDRLDVLARSSMPMRLNIVRWTHPTPSRRSNSVWSSKVSPGGTWRRSLVRAPASPRF